jgi:small subunit ribosomal protein S6
VHAYETIFITPAELLPAKHDELTERVTSIVTKAGGEIQTVDKWGRRRLAYPIGRHREGFYTLIAFKSPGAVPAEITQLYKVSEDVIRHLTYKALRFKPAPPVPAAPASAAKETTPHADAPQTAPA